jgi:hypothetical protein
MQSSEATPPEADDRNPQLAREPHRGLHVDARQHSVAVMSV